MTPDRACVIYFPFGGTEYTQCKASAALVGVATKTGSKVKSHLDGTPGSPLVIVGHGKQRHSAGREPKIYGEDGFWGRSKKSAVDLVAGLRADLGATLSTTKISGIYLWVCYSSTNGLGAAVKGGLRATNIPVYATPVLIDGVGVWNTRLADFASFDSFVVMP